MEVYFFSNLTEEVWIPLKEVFEADYKRQLRFQLVHDGLDTSEESKVHVLYKYTLPYSCFGISFISFCINQNDANTNTTSIDNRKIAAKSKPRSVRQNLNGSIFTNMQHLHPAFQIFIL